MLRRITSQSPLVFTAGLISGLMLFVGMLIGSAQRPAATWQLPEQLLHASATDSGETMAMATGEIADGVEGVFLLDYLTGEVRCWVVHPRTGALGGMFRHNVMQDLGADTGKATKYLMVTGRANFRSTGGAVQRADSVLYVANSTSGQFAAYSIPWNRNAANVGAAQAAPLVLIGGGAIRDAAVLRE